MSNLGQEVVRRHEQRIKKKSPWLQLWQICGEYIKQVKQDFTGPLPAGDMLNRDLFDSTAVDAATKASAAMRGMLWQSGSKSFKLQPLKKSKNKSSVVRKYFDAINEVVREAFDDPKAGFANADEEYMNDQFCFGTSALACFEGTDSDLSFEAWGVDEASIGLGFGGRVEETSREFQWELRRVVREYGLEALSSKLQDLARHGKLDEKVCIIHEIMPREQLIAGMLSNQNMPIRSVHVEKDTKHVVKESGYPEQPVSWGFMYKMRNEDYGRSQGMKGLPDILEINATKEMRLLAREKALAPPHAVYSDSIMGNQKIDFTPHGVTVIKASGKLKSGNPIFPLYDGANIQEADKAIEMLKQDINGHFMLDRLIDFNNTVEMTLGEVQMRAQLRGESLGSIFHRQILVRQQIIERGVAILFRKGKLGVVEGSNEHRIALQFGEEPLIIPDEIAKLILSGQDFYEVKFFSPAARMMEAEEANGVRRTWEGAAMIASVTQSTEIYDNLDEDKSAEIFARNFGVEDILRGRDMIEEIRTQRHQMMEQAAEQQQRAQETAIAAEASKIKQPA